MYRRSAVSMPLRRRVTSLAFATVVTVLAAVGGGVPAAAQPATAVPASATATPTVGAAVSTFSLPNGLSVVVIPDHRAPVVTHMIWYKAGSADEPAGRSGIAHYLEHLMFKGTKANPDGAFSKKVSEIGGQENAFTSYDYTAYYQRVAKEHLGKMMALEADRMQNLAFDPKVAEPELKVVLEERSMRTDNDPSAQLGEAVEAALHRNHPYRIPVIGWKHEIESLTVADAFAFYDRYYTPNNAILVVAGDIDEKTVRDLALDTYGRVPRRAEPGVRKRVRDPEMPGVVRLVTLADERVAQPSWRRVHQVPSERTGAPGEAEALDVLADVLGGGANSRLYRKLVADRGIAANAGAYYRSGSLDDGALMIYATPRDGIGLEDLGKAVDEVVAELVRDGPTAEEVERSVKKVRAEWIRSQDNQATLARIFGQVSATGGSVEEVRTWPERIRKVGVADVRTVAATWLTGGSAVTGHLKSAPSTGKAVSKRPMPFDPGSTGHIRHHEDASLPALPPVSRP